MLTLGGGSQGQQTVNRKRLLSGWLFVLGTTLLNGALDLLIVIGYHGYVRRQFGKDSQQDEEYFQLMWFEGNTGLKSFIYLYFTEIYNSIKFSPY